MARVELHGIRLEEKFTAETQSTQRFFISSSPLGVFGVSVVNHPRHFYPRLRSRRLRARRWRRRLCRLRLDLQRQARGDHRNHPAG
jgi:hypothetical protein